MSGLRVYLCSPRGFCAGVVRAIDVVEAALQRFGAPVYVRHQIVHNRFVVESLKKKGAIFVSELSEIPEGTTAPVIFSAHGVPKSIPEQAQSLNFFSIDATCPLVTKVHREAQLHHKKGRHIFLIGHRGHPEVIGTMGQLPEGAVTLLETVEDVAGLSAYRTPLAYVTQTTLSVEDTAAIVEALTLKFPDIHAPHKEDICYATTNRQEAVKRVAPHVEAFIVVGAPNSSNSQRLKEVALTKGTPFAVLIERAADLDLQDFAGVRSIGVTAGASAPEVLVEEVLEKLSHLQPLEIETVTAAVEDVYFPMPRVLREAEMVEAL